MVIFFHFGISISKSALEARRRSGKSFSVPPSLLFKVSGCGFYHSHSSPWRLFRMALLPFAALPSFESLLAAGSWDMISLCERIQQLAELLVSVLAMNTTTN
jgi:hypothetical protein